MLRDEAVDMVKQVLGFKSGMDDTIVTNLQMQQLELELGPTKPWFLLSENSVYTMEVGEQRVPLPADFLEEYEEGALSYRPADYPTSKEVDLAKSFVDELKVLFKDTEDGEPQAYALSGEYFVVYPTPADAYALRMKYYKRALVLSTNIENGWLKYAPSILIGQAGAVIAASLRDWNAKEQFDKMQQKGVLLLQNQNEARKHANMDLQMGGRHV